jgi:transcriptional regulator with XRE-family HTH domain
VFVTTVQDIIFGIITQKEATGMTNQQIADSAKVSKTTVDRLLRNDPGTSPNAQTLIDVANAVGYQIGGTEPHSEVREIYEEQIKQTEAHYNRMLTLQNRWLRFAVLLCLILLVFVIAMLLFDVTQPDTGWITDKS